MAIQRTPRTDQPKASREQGAAHFAVQLCALHLQFSKQNVPAKRVIHFQCLQEQAMCAWECG